LSDWFAQTDQARDGAMCNKAIIIISDEVIETYEEIFQQYSLDDMKARKQFLRRPYLIRNSNCNGNCRIIMEKSN